MARGASRVVRPAGDWTRTRKRKHPARSDGGAHQHPSDPGTVASRSEAVAARHAAIDPRSARGGGPGRGCRCRNVGTSDMSRASRRGVPRAHPGAHRWCSSCWSMEYAALWFITPYYVASMIGSLVTIIVYRRVPVMRSRPLPLSGQGRGPRRCSCSVAPSHDAGTRAATELAHDPTARPLYGCHGAGRGRDREDVGLHVSVRRPAPALAKPGWQRKIGGLVLEVKGDFCGQVRSILSRVGRSDDYLEIGLDTGVCYNPLHNDLDPYAVAYAIAAEQSVRSVQGAVLAAGVHRLAQIRDPPTADHRWIHNVLRGLPAHPGRWADSPRYRATQSRVVEPTGCDSRAA